MRICISSSSSSSYISGKGIPKINAAPAITWPVFICFRKWGYYVLGALIEGFSGLFVFLVCHL
jgi:hypothetical protein